MLLEITRITVPPGQTVVLEDISWDEFEAILEDLGESRSSRIAYDQGTLEIMTPLPEHEVNKEYIGNFVKVLLEELDIEFCPLGSTTFKNQVMFKGIEPDSCFYIEHETAVRGKDRLDLNVDPPPDLALEIDITNRSHPEIYQSLGVPELWQYEKEKLKFLLLVEGKYIESETSSNFPNFPLLEVIPQYLIQCRTEGRNKGMKAFRRWVKDRLQVLEAKIN
ncbi:Uma2 family endonuclease [Pleurocapsa sp. PCC 7319]|uniref:Uma2 family endonuclease n=1 Tax=Pleurocapsa sp. PCC 7319 TaxID=118161 RepID=UPI000344F9F6|nr:Uma2 family endonuclease [Pleurocapsa sp. PCC 7319]